MGALDCPSCGAPGKYRRMGICGACDIHDQSMQMLSHADRLRELLDAAEGEEVEVGTDMLDALKAARRALRQDATHLQNIAGRLGWMNIDDEG